MSKKTKIDIHKNMTRSELNKALHNNVSNLRYYQRLVAMNIISLNDAIKPAADFLNINYVIVHK